MTRYLFYCVFGGTAGGGGGGEGRGVTGMKHENNEHKKKLISL